MKANELMINDWVQQQGCTSPSRVAGVTQGKIHTCWADGTKHAKDQYYFSPVPLTPEILEKNGWRLDEIDGTYRNTLNVFGREAPFCIFAYVNINYVHELQHALRLRGLTELADNFQI